MSKTPSNATSGTLSGADIRAVQERSDIKPDTVVATMYGGVLMFRGWCRDCRKNAFLEAGRLVCCGEQYEAKRIIQARIATRAGRREEARAGERNALIADQQGLCFYCTRPFWSEVYRKRRVIVLQPTTDHFVPYVLCQSRNGKNKVAACHICNGLKSTRVFMDTDMAREFIHLRWVQKGYRDTQGESGGAL